MYACKKFQSNQSNSCWDITVWNREVDWLFGQNANDVHVLRADVLRVVLCDRESVQMAAGLQPGGGPSLQREEEDGGPSSHLRPVWQRLPIHANRYVSHLKINAN